MVHISVPEDDNSPAEKISNQTAKKHQSSRRESHKETVPVEDIRRMTEEPDARPVGKMKNRKCLRQECKSLDI